MQTEIADVVHPIFQRGIALRSALDAHEPLEWAQERAALKQLLAKINAAGAPGHGESDEIVFDFTKPNAPEERGRLTRLTIHYALTAWLDEFLIHHSAWGARWRDAPLETELYGNRMRGSKFWDEARYVQTRGDDDALEVMYLCVALGFRGDWRAKPPQVAEWIEHTRTQLQQSAKTWTMPASLEPLARETNVPADGAYRGVTFLVVMAAALLAPIALMVLWRI